MFTNSYWPSPPSLLLIEHEQCMRMGCDLVPQHEEFCLNEYDLLLSICLKILIYVDLPKRSAWNYTSPFLAAIGSYRIKTIQLFIFQNYQQFCKFWIFLTQPGYQVHVTNLGSHDHWPSIITYIGCMRKHAKFVPMGNFETRMLPWWSRKPAWFP